MRFLSIVTLLVAFAVPLTAQAQSGASVLGGQATALRLTKRPGTAMLAAASIGLLGVWSGILVAYDSSAWPGHHGWPVSFSVVAVIFVLYLAAELQSWARAGRAQAGHGRAATRSR